MWWSIKNIQICSKNNEKNGYELLILSHWLHIAYPKKIMFVLDPLLFHKKELDR